MANLISKCPIPLVFKKVLKDKLDGILEIKGDEFEKQLFFSNGNLQFATSSLVKDCLGEILFSKGKIDKALLVTLERIEQDMSEKIGKFLVKNKYIFKKDLCDALIYQIKSIASSTFSLESGEWEFTIKNPRLNKDQMFNIRIYEVIIEGVRQIDDVSYYKDIFLFKCPISTILPESVRKLLTPDERIFFTKLAQFTHYTNEQIAAKLKIPEDQYWQRIILFYIMNIVDFIEYRIDQKLNEKIEEINELHEKLKSKETDAFELFGLEETVSTKEIKEVYESISEEMNPDKIATAPDSEIKKKAIFVLEEINKVYEAINNEGKKISDDIRENIQKGGADLQENETEMKSASKKDLCKKARKLYLKAHTFYDQKKYNDATVLLEEAIKLDSTRSNYYMLLGLSQTKIPSLKTSAEKSLKKVAEMEPWNADPLFYLGELYRSENLINRAEKYFRMALKINMDHTLAGREIESFKRKSSKSLLSSLFLNK